MTLEQPSDARLIDAVDTLWLLAAAVRLMLRGGGTTQPLDQAARRLLAAASVEVPGGDDGLVRGRALRSQLAQALALADPEADVQWADLDDATLLAQGRASGFNALMWLSPESPVPALRERLSRPGAVFLDVGTGVGAISRVLCEHLPELRCIGLDIMPRALALADRELTTAGVRDRVDLREQDVATFEDADAIDVAWVPLPLLSADIVQSAVKRVLTALRPGGLVVVAANRPPTNDLTAALAELRALTVGGNPAWRDDVVDWLTSAGAVEVCDVPTPPMAPAILVATRGQ